MFVLRVVELLPGEDTSPAEFLCALQVEFSRSKLSLCLFETSLGALNLLRPGACNRLLQPRLFRSASGAGLGQLGADLLVIQSSQDLPCLHIVALVDIELLDATRRFGRNFNP